MKIWLYSQALNPEKVVRATWFISAVLITLAGVLYGLDKSYKPLIYFHLLLPIFAAAIVMNWPTTWGDSRRLHCRFLRSRGNLRIQKIPEIPWS